MTLLCGCQPPHKLCEIGQALQNAYFTLHAAVDEAMRTNDKSALLAARQRVNEAEARYLKHIGLNRQTDVLLLNLAYERLFGHGARTWPDETAIVQREVKRLYAAAGEPLPRALQDSPCSMTQTAILWPNDADASYTIGDENA